MTPKPGTTPTGLLAFAADYISTATNRACATTAVDVAAVAVRAQAVRLVLSALIDYTAALAGQLADTQPLGGETAAHAHLARTIDGVRGALDVACGFASDLAHPGR